MELTATTATAPHAAPPRRGPRSVWTAPGLLRALWVTVAAAALAFGLVVALRAIQHLHPVIKGGPIVTVILLASGLAFLVGIGGFDYWGRWMIGAPTEPEDHSGHGARSWRDYFRVNTDHKVIGIQYTVTALFFLLVGGFLRSEERRVGKECTSRRRA